MKSWMNPELIIEERVNLLLAEMTLQEKIGQTQQIRNISTEHAEDIRAGKIGTSLFASGAWAGNIRDEGVRVGMINDVQKIAVEESRLGIPVIFARDVIHGHRTVFPIPLGQSATWDDELIEEGARIAAVEASADGLHWTFTPMLDIGRDPRWGRVAESFGEDPYLCAQLARASVRGYQGDDLSKPDSIAACAKHYVGYAGAEGGRDYNTVDIGPRSLRDTYLPSFKAAVEEGVATIMSSFNDIDGIPMTANIEVLRKILKEELGFDGLVVTDWNAIQELENHGVASDRLEACVKAMKAGADIDMVSDIYIEQLETAIDRGLVTINELDDAVRRILRVKFQLGAFDRPYADPEIRQSVTLTESSRQSARKCAADSMVLLQNNNAILPLSKSKGQYMVCGPFVDADHELYGTWTLDGLPEDVVSIRQGIETALKDNPDKLRFKTGFADEAVLHARLVDTALVCIGEHPCRSGEANSTVTIEPPAGQIELLESIARIGTPIVAVVFAGRPLDLRRVCELADAVLFCWHPGIEGGNALADVLFGEVNPNGRLTMTFPRDTGQIPLYYNHKPTGRPTDVHSRPQNRYADSPDAPLFPFGYGLSYTTFEYSEVLLSKDSINIDEKLTASITITNTGKTEGAEVAQLYIRDRFASISRPVRELKGYEKITLAPGESKIVSFDIDATCLHFTGIDLNQIVEPGEFEVWISPDALSGKPTRFTLKGDKPIIL